MSPYRQPAVVAPEEKPVAKARPNRQRRTTIGILLTLPATPTCDLAIEHDSRLWILGVVMGLVGLFLIAQNNRARDA